MVKISKSHHKTKTGVIKRNPKKVRKTFNLPIQVAIIVPSTKNFDEKISAAEFKKRIVLTKKYLTTLFGGFTSVDSVGGYVKDKKLIQEDGMIVTAYATKSDYSKHKVKVMDWVRDIGDTWGQDSMGVIIENDLKYISWGKK